MYNQFFRLNQAPFSISPDPRYLFMSERHREALAHLLYGVNSGGGFILLTGEIGAGKTTICRCLLEQIPANCNVAYIFNPKLTVNDLLQSICDEFHIAPLQPGAPESGVKHYVDALNTYLLHSHANGQNNILVIDEAQNLSAEVLEQLRLLTNLETNERKLLQIILIGQPELRTMLQRPELEQLAQRVIARYHLGSLSLPETASYIMHRLSIAGLTSASPFSGKLIRYIHRMTQGIPRRINLLCDRALLGAYAENKSVVDRAIVDKAAAEIFTPGAKRWDLMLQLRMLGSSLLAIVGIAAIVGAWTLHHGGVSKSLTASRTALSGIFTSAFPLTPSSTPAALAVTAPAPETGDDPLATSLRDENSAYRQLAQLWGVTLADGDPCQRAQDNDLHCYQSNGGLNELRQIDRPAILTLRDDTDKTYYALLTGLSNTSATLRIGNSTKTFDLLTLTRYFHGDIATFWRAPKQYREKIRAGYRGEDVDWLATQLTKMSGGKQALVQQTYDQSMIRQVRQFQAAHGLKTDGVIGPKTYMLINDASGVTEPRLQFIETPSSTAPGE